MKHRGTLVLVGLALVLATGCGDSGTAAETPTPSNTAAEASLAGLPLLVASPPDGYVAAGDPVHEADDKGESTYSIWTSETTGCSIRHQAMTTPVAEGSQVTNDQTNTKSVIDSLISSMSVQATSWNDQVSFNSVQGPVAAAASDVTNDTVTGRVQARVSVQSGQVIMTLMLCHKDAFDETGWGLDLAGLQVSGFNATDW